VGYPTQQKNVVFRGVFKWFGGFFKEFGEFSTVQRIFLKSYPPLPKKIWKKSPALIIISPPEKCPNHHESINFTNKKVYHQQKICPILH
jgi:hypothetical protein